MILVVGATGQLGSLIVRELGRHGKPVRAMVRPPDAGRDLVEAGAELVTGDLLRPETLDGALRGVRAVIATANVVAPTRRGDSHDALARGYEDLIPRARAAGVERFVYASVPDTPLDRVVPMMRAKRRVEELLAASGMSYVSVRMPPFTEVSPSSAAPSRCAASRARRWRGPTASCAASAGSPGAPSRTGPDGAAGVGVDAQGLSLGARRGTGDGGRGRRDGVHSSRPASGCSPVWRRRRPT